ncbi:hypothetical protein A9G00_21560 [Achromobacter xylosoxidans]|nr:hypothetical protein A7P23_20675 [Achromobacter xylosoxidans]ODA18311.1 hypothetical protein A9G00_21560 [Achromobacter xylosoxidans]
MIQRPYSLELRSFDQALAVYTKRTQAKARFEWLNELKAQFLDESWRAIGIGYAVNSVEPEARRGIVSCLGELGE